MLGGQDIVVQCDESKFVKLKSNRGRPSENVRRKYWCFGLYDTATKKVVLKIVKNRRQTTLFRIIRTYVSENSTIWTDEFSVYTGGPDYPTTIPSPLALLGPFLHQVVNHSLCFKDPVTGVNTNAIEGTWCAAKKKFKNMNGTTKRHLQSYVDEYCWRKNYSILEAAFFNICALFRDYNNV
jgi:transposase-like protein